jgi:hypothetical protein
VLRASYRSEARSVWLDGFIAKNAAASREECRGCSRSDAKLCFFFIATPWQPQESRAIADFPAAAAT